MKKLILILALILSSCSVDNVIEQNQVISQNCGTIVSLGHDQRGDFIIVKMPYYTYEQDRYKVPNYQDYDLGQEVCNFSGLQKEPM